MTRKIECYFSMLSPWAYMGHARFMEIAAAGGVTVDWRPTSLPALFGETGGQPLAKRHPVRQAYRLVELQRWSDVRNVPLKLHPAHWPFDAALADRVVIAAMQEGHDPSAFIGAGMGAVWDGERDLADPAEVQAVADANGLPGAELVENADAPAVVEAYAANTARAEKDGAFGSPTYLLDGEPFWGQDRLELLEMALKSGRKPIRPAA